MKPILAMCGWTAAALGLAACTQHTIKVEPIEVKPIHMTLDVTIRVDRELDQFFDFEDKVAPRPANPNAPIPPVTPDPTTEQGAR